MKPLNPSKLIRVELSQLKKSDLSKLQELGLFSKSIITDLKQPRAQAAFLDPDDDYMPVAVLHKHRDRRAVEALEVLKGDCVLSINQKRRLINMRPNLDAHYESQYARISEFRDGVHAMLNELEPTRIYLNTQAPPEDLKARVFDIDTDALRDRYLGLPEGSYALNLFDEMRAILELIESTEAIQSRLLLEKEKQLQALNDELHDKILKIGHALMAFLERTETPTPLSDELKALLEPVSAQAADVEAPKRTPSIDDVLAKIREHGIDSLTPEEVQALQSWGNSSR